MSATTRTPASPRDPNDAEERSVIFVRPDHRVIDVAKAYAEYLNGKSLPALARKYKVSAASFSKQFARCGFPLRPGCGRRRRIAPLGAIDSPAD